MKASLGAHSCGMTSRLFLLLMLALLAGCASAPRFVTDSAHAPVNYIIELKLREGFDREFLTVMRSMVAATGKETGTLIYEWYLDEDGSSCHIHEMFADTAAYKQHSDTFGKRFAKQFLACVEIQGVTVYGRPDATAREMLAGLGPVYYRGIGGFRR